MLAESDAVEASDAPLGQIVQFAAADAIDTLVAADPEITAPVFEDLKDAVVEQPLLRPIVGKLAVAQPAQPVVIRPDPERPFDVFIERAHLVSHESFSR